ncbi:MAG: hypothetical protein ACJA07_000220 [Rhodococcus sp. (in: high G+C Gram-positive bacteria)]
MEFDEIGGGRSSIDEAVAAALSSLDSIDPATAADAQLGWEGLRGLSPPAGPTQSSVQTFLWQHLVEIAEDPERAWEIALALAELLDRLGHARYADIARSPRTRALLDNTDDAGRQSEIADAVAASGIGPPDTDLITWQDTPEGPELAVVSLIGETLEVATIAGEFAPSRVGGRPLRDAAVAAKRRRLTDSVLRSERAGGVLIEQLLDHRIMLWTRYSPPRIELYRDTAEVLHEAVEPAYSCVRRLEGLLALVGDGIDLTERGYLPGAVVERALGTLWTPSEWPFPPGEEIDTVPVLRVRRLLRRLGLVRRHHGRLLPTARARGMSADRMWTTLIGGFVGTAYHPDTIAAEVVFADIARGAPPAGEAELLTEILTAEGWTHHGGPVPSESVGPLAGDVLADLTALGAFTYDATRRGSSTTVPSPDGVRLGAALLRHRLMHTQMPSL